MKKKIRRKIQEIKNDAVLKKMLVNWNIIFKIENSTTVEFQLCRKEENKEDESKTQNSDEYVIKYVEIFRMG